MKGGLTRRMLVASALLALAVAAVFAGVIKEVRDDRESWRLAERAAEVAAAANDLERLAIDLQTGVRGFVITGNDEFLTPWQGARDAIPARARELELLIVDPVQKQRARDMIDDIHEFDEEFASPLLAAARVDPARARAIVASGEGNRRMDAIRAQFDSFRRREQELLAAREAHAEADARETLVFSAAGLGGSVLLVVLFAAYLSRAVTAPIRDVARSAARVAAGDLSARVREQGAGEIRELARSFNTMTASLRQARDESERAEEAARREATISHAVLDATLDGIRLVDPHGNTLVANSAMERLADEVLELPGEGTIWERTAALAERTTDPERYRAAMKEIAENPEHESLDEYELVSGHAIERYTAPVRDASGELLGRIFVIRDITSEREAERLKAELMATVSHELRTPLASILGFAELLVEREVDARTRERYLETIHSEAKRLTALINDFLDLQRIEERRFAFARQPFDLADVLAEQVELFSGQSTAHTLVLDAASGPLHVVGERDRIAQVVGNLLSNAIKYSPAGGTVRVSAEPPDSIVRVSVTDSGLGIPADQQPHVFAKFFRVDSSDTRAIGGTGLGLALAREIVQAHGGRIGFESAEGEGSTFWFELPAAQRAGGGTHVLVVEDDPAAAALLSEYLAADGYAVTVAVTGEEALVRAKSEPPDLICLDIMLAGELDGWQVLSRLKEERDTARLPVVVCTVGNGRERAAALGAADFITKPFSARRLLEAVTRIVPPHGGSVLVVDDEDTVRRLVVETLGNDGLELREAADGDEALAAIAERKPDAVILDLLMPGLDGFAVLERLHADPETRDLPVIVLTARRLTPDERGELKARAVSLLEKSDYSAAELRRLVQRALGTQALE